MQIKKKKWFDVLAPQEFGGKVIATTIAAEESNLIGRKLILNLMYLLNDYKKHNAKVTFKINNVANGRAQTELLRYELLLSNLKRLVRKAKDKINDSFVVETKDKVKVRMKPYFITKNRAQRRILSAIKKRAREFMAETVAKDDFSNIMLDVFSSKLQRELKDVLNKVYPLAICELSVVERSTSERKREVIP